MEPKVAIVETHQGYDEFSITALWAGDSVESFVELCRAHNPGYTIRAVSPRETILELHGTHPTHPAADFHWDFTVYHLKQGLYKA